MSAISPEAWPTATLDGVRRLEVLAAVLPGVHLEQREIDLLFERVWDAMGTNYLSMQVIIIFLAAGLLRAVIYAGISF